MARDHCEPIVSYTPLTGTLRFAQCWNDILLPGDKQLLFIK